MILLRRYLELLDGENKKKNVSVEGSQTQIDYMPLYRAQRGSNDEILQSPNEKSCGPEQDLVTGHSNGPDCLKVQRIWNIWKVNHWIMPWPVPRL